VNWQLASLTIVVCSLAACFWWYERSHPSSKELALVATMAALSALGRDAFAALPDVKPTTTMVLICGYAFGVGPGFAVGAVGALASNIFLGQGSWTPWQMIAWAIVGVAGALLGRLLGRRPLGRWTLALACALAAELFNLLIDLYSWSVGGAHTLGAYGAWVASAFSFDITHVIASFLFGLTFGPALMRMLVRARTRLEITWEPLPVASVMIAAVLLGGAGLLAPQDAARARAASAPSARPPGVVLVVASAADASAARLDISRELSFLAAAQNSDGGFGGARGQSSSELYSAWVAMGLAAAGRDPLSLRRDAHNVLDALRAEASSLQGAGDLERTILALHACGASVRSLPGGDPVSRLLGFRDSDGSFARQSNLTAFAILALRAAGYPPSDPRVRAAGRWLTAQQDPDGGFGFAGRSPIGRGGGSDVDDTAAALQALVDAGVRTGPVVAHATAFLVRAQNPDGGYPQQQGGESNAQSTAWAIQGLIAAARNVSTVKREGSRSPLGYLESLIAPDGSVRYSRTGSQTPVWVTAQALTALAGKPLPIAPVRPAASQSRATSAAARPVHTNVRRRSAGFAAARAATAGPTARLLNILAHGIGALLGTVLAP
jgi:energy-coupling factor transport system substrate-specific component